MAALADKTQRAVQIEEYLISALHEVYVSAKIANKFKQASGGFTVAAAIDAVPQVLRAFLGLDSPDVKAEAEASAVSQEAAGNGAAPSSIVREESIGLKIGVSDGVPGGLKRQMTIDEKMNAQYKMGPGGEAPPAAGSDAVGYAENFPAVAPSMVSSTSSGGGQSASKVAERIARARHGNLKQNKKLWGKAGLTRVLLPSGTKKALRKSWPPSAGPPPGPILTRKISDVKAQTRVEAAAKRLSRRQASSRSNLTAASAASSGVRIERPAAASPAAAAAATTPSAPTQPAADVPFADAFRDFLSNNDLSIASHVGAFEALLPSLMAGSTNHDAPGASLREASQAQADKDTISSATATYALLHRSTDVLQRLYEREHELAYRLRGSLETLHKRHKLYRAKYWDCPPGGKWPSTREVLSELKLAKFADVFEKDLGKHVGVAEVKEWGSVLRLHDTHEGRVKYRHALESHGVDHAHLVQFVERVERDVSSCVAHVLVLGGGPMGLLCAIELALLGHRVTVKEARDQLNRLNILRLWPETSAALAKTYGLEKVDNGILWGQSKPTASTTRLQLALLKVALISGVRIELDEKATKPPGQGGFSLSKDTKAYDALVIACGHKSALLQTLRSQTKDGCRIPGMGDTAAASASASSASSASASSASDPFAVGEKANSTATALVAHFEVTDRSDGGAKYAKELPHTFDWTVNDAITFDSSDAATRKRALERFSKSEGLCCAIGPSAVAAALEKTFAAAGNGGACLENVLMYANKEKIKREASGKTELANLKGVPPSYYFIMTLKEPFVRELVVKMVAKTLMANGTCASEADAAAQASKAAPTNAKEALEWAMEQQRKAAGEGGGQVSHQAFEDVAGHAAGTIATVFTANLANTKKLPPFTTVCSLLRDVPTGEAYDASRWKRTTDIFDFSVSRHMKSAAVVVDKVDGQPRMQTVPSRRIDGGKDVVTPLLVMHAGDALQEPFWPEGLGVNRGSHNVFDAAWCCNKWLAARATGEAAVQALLRERQQLFQSFTMPMSGKARRMLMGFNNNNEPTPALGKVYQKASMDPLTRYNASAFGFKDLCFPEWSLGCRRPTKYG